MSTPKHTLVVISPDPNTDYCYLDMSKDAAIEQFKQHEDWHEIYQPRGYVVEAVEHELDGNFFMLWRNQGTDIAALATERGMAPEIARLFSGGK